MGSANPKLATKRMQYIDILNIGACFCVVWLHCTGGVFNFSNTRLWWASMIFQTIAHWSVPVFFMITGATLLDYRNRYSTKQFFKKRIFRIFIPFLIWSCIYLLWDIHGGCKVTGIKDIINMFLNNKILYIYWFFYTLFALYLCIPVLSIIAKKSNIKIIYYFCGLCFLNSSILPLIPKFLNIPVCGFFTNQLPTGYMGYLLLGWILKNETFQKRIRISIYIAGLLGAVSMIFGTFWLSNRINQADGFLMDYPSIPCLLISISVFILMKHIDFNILKSDFANKIIHSLSSASFGVYLIQILVLTYLTRFLKMNAPVLMTLGALLVYGISVAIVLTCKKIPLIKRIVP